MGPAVAADTIPASAPKRANRKRFFALEVCCGSAWLTKILIHRGFDAKGVDWSGNKDVPQGPVVVLDLTTAEGQQEFRKL